MKPIMLVLAIAMAFVVALPSGVWAQSEGERRRPAILEAALERTEAAAKRAEAAAERGISAVRRGDIEAAEAARKELSDISAESKDAQSITARYWETHESDWRAGQELRARVGRAYSSLMRALDEHRKAERALEAAEAAREAQAESVGLEEAARLVGERVREDYGVIFGIYENAELAVALAERALEAAESEDDYAEAWKRHRGATQYRDGVNDIAVRAERLANASVGSVNEAINYLSQAKDEGDNLRIHNLTELAKMAVGNAAENAVEVKNLRAQLEE